MGKTDSAYRIELSMELGFLVAGFECLIFLIRSRFRPKNSNFGPRMGKIDSAYKTEPSMELDVLITDFEYLIFLIRPRFGLKILHLQGFEFDLTSKIE